MRALVAAAGVLALALVGCSGGNDEAPSAGPSTSSSPAGDTVRATLGDVELELEVADSPEERATGLMRRQEVPPGTGMLFSWGEPVQARFYMFDVPIPLKAVFVREGEVVYSVVMPPCTEPEPGDCPLYGPDEQFDTVVETAPETLPDVEVGDRLVVEG
jgi:uncharacterized membrane protein (UPF0127 family)